jgi:hypothetical protein
MGVRAWGNILGKYKFCDPQKYSNFLILVNILDFQVQIPSKLNKI